MNENLIFDLDHNKERLEYYVKLKSQYALKSDASDKQLTARAGAVDKWIEIYAERIQKLEVQLSKLGLKTQLATERRATAEAEQSSQAFH